MKIFLSGAQGTGKSSIIKHISSNSLFPELKKYDSYSKLFLKTRNEQCVEHENYLNFQNKIFLFCSNIYVNESNFISSRSFADSFAYLSSSFKETKSKEIKKNLKTLIDNVTVFSRLLSSGEKVYYFYTPIEFPLNVENNNLRLSSETHQFEIDFYIRKFFKENNVAYITLKGTVEERVALIFKTVNGE